MLRFFNGVAYILMLHTGTVNVIKYNSISCKMDVTQRLIFMCVVAQDFLLSKGWAVKLSSIITIYFPIKAGKASILSREARQSLLLQVSYP